MSDDLMFVLLKFKINASVRLGFNMGSSGSLSLAVQITFDGSIESNRYSI